MRPAVYDVRCMMCGAEMGQVVGGTFHSLADVRPVLPRRGGLPRCSKCGGSLYLDPGDSSLYRPTVQPTARRSREIA